MNHLHLIHESTTLRRGLVADREAKHFRAMKQSLWLYLYLLLAVNRATGTRLLSPGAVAREMGIREETIRSWLGHLRRQGYVRVERVGSHLHVTVKKWGQESVKETLHSTPASKKAPENGDHTPPRSESLLTPEELARRLGAEPVDEFLTEAVEEVDAATLEDIVAQVERVPEERIRKSRLALFRYLLKRRRAYPLDEDP